MEGLNLENVTQLLQLIAIVCGIGIFGGKFPVNERWKGQTISSE